jgi:hypothetical protein
MALNGFVCYCPELRLYWYKVSNNEKPDQDADYKFNDEELENAIATHLANDQTTEAKFMAELTGLARVNPHKIVQIDQGNDKIEVIDSEAFWKTQDAPAPSGG